MQRSLRRPPRMTIALPKTESTNKFSGKVLIVISTCSLYQHNGYNQAMRDTWIKDVPSVQGLDYKFFVGRGSIGLASDEVLLDVGDDYESLTHKTIEGHRWAIDHGYDFIFQCFGDTYVRPERLMSSGFELYDYTGYPLVNTPGGGTCIPREKANSILGDFFSGGAGYMMSRKATELMLKNLPDDISEDRWVGRVLSHPSILRRSDKRYNPWEYPIPLKSNDFITCHLTGMTGRGKYDSKSMYQTHEQWLRG